MDGTVDTDVVRIFTDRVTENKVKSTVKVMETGLARELRLH